MFSNFFSKISPFTRKYKKILRSRTIRLMYVAWWINKATGTLFRFIAFSLQQWLHERAPMLRYTYIAGFVCVSYGI
jgi:hypothetical protein